MTRRRLRTAGVVVAALVVGGCGISQAVQPTAPTATDAAQNAVLPANRTYTVTLLTGDVVTVRTRQSGCPGVSVQPAKPNGGFQSFCGPDGHVQVIPGSVTPLVGRVLDEDLFDVTTLIKEGYDDASSTEIPLIMRGGKNRGAVPALAEQRALPSIGAVAGRQPKTGGADFVEALAGQATARAEEGPQVWLDHRVKATQDTDGKSQLDANLRQVKAPQAWTAGHTGKNTRVAVLDTGADPTHPDLAGKIVEKADFTVEGGDAVDHFGHGTHVAATIAGSGAGSGGTRRGVAPDAQLVIGKVLDDEGSGTDSGVIAGMEWAASRAKVVNMSLGGDYSDGTDPLSQALDALTAQYGTLFVVSSGNYGPFEATVTTPAAAPSALAVGAVDSKDALADFSSRGPLVGTRALKPEIVAPGVDIVAARAAGTTMGTPVDAKYTRASGTSMAAPHVAGAAAIVAQLHPDWDASRIKAALVGSTDATSGDPYEAGAGRLNVARATGSVASGTGVVNLGTFAYPQSGTAETKVSWNNTGGKAVQLNLAVRLIDRNGKKTTDPALTLSATKVTVPAGGGESAVLRLDRAKFGARPGLYTAMVTATWPGGGTASTPVSFYVEPESHDLTVSYTPPPGSSPDMNISGRAYVVNLDDPALFNTVAEVEGGPVTLRVPAGRYSVMGKVTEWNPADGEQIRVALTGDSDVAVSSATEVVLDGAAAKPVATTVDGKDTVQAQAAFGFVQHARRGLEWGAFVNLSDEAAGNQGLFATPTENVGIGSFAAHAAFVLDTVDKTTHYNLMRDLPDRIPADPSFRVTAAEHARLARIDQRFLTTDIPGAETSHRRMGESTDGLWLIEEYNNPIPPPTRVDYVSPEGVWTDSSGTTGIGRWGAAWVEPRQRYAAGSRQEKVWSRQPLRPDWFGGGSSLSACVPPPVVRTSTLLRVQLVELTDQHGRFTCLAPDDSWGDSTSRAMTLYQNGQVVGTHASSIGEFPMSKEKADYRLTYDLDASAVLPVSTKVNTAWTFTSTGSSGTSDAAVPLLSVDYALPLDTNNRPTTGEAGFTVHQMPGTAAQKVTEFKAWTSVDDGATWTQVDVRKAADNRFSAQLPEALAGQAVSLRIAVAADGGSGMEQTILRAYRTP